MNFYENNLPSESKIILIYKNYSTSNNNSPYKPTNKSKNCKNNYS